MTADEANDKTDAILDILEEGDTTLAEAVAMLEMVKFNILVAAQPETAGVTLQ